MHDQNLSMEVAARPDQIRLVRGRLAEFTRGQDWGEDDADALLLAVGEACNNAVNYGGKGLADPRLSVRCRRLDADRLQVDVCNQGNGFHPDLQHLGRLPSDEAYATCGRGFGLMLALVDDVQVDSDGANTVVRLTKRKTA